ncbi:STAS domain-containing protein [Nocardiopsis coralliicola]
MDQREIGAAAGSGVPSAPQPREAQLDATVPELTANLATRGGAAIVALRGEIDLGSQESFRTALEAALAQAPNRLVLDFTEVRFIDSSGLQVLISAHETASAAGIGIAVAAPSRHIAKVLHVTSLDRRVAVWDSVDRALGRDTLER